MEPNSKSKRNKMYMSGAEPRSYTFFSDFAPVRAHDCRVLMGGCTANTSLFGVTIYIAAISANINPAQRRMKWVQLWKNLSYLSCPKTG